jgi:hypothetical protein
MPKERFHVAEIQQLKRQLENPVARWISAVNYEETKAYTFARDVAEQLVADFENLSLHMRRADRLLSRIEAWTPIKLREELLGDIREDVEHRREQGWTERKLRRLIWWQFGYAIVGWLWGRMERVLELIPRSGK